MAKGSDWSAAALETVVLDGGNPVEADSVDATSLQPVTPGKIRRRRTACFMTTEHQKWAADEVWRQGMEPVALFYPSQPVLVERSPRHGGGIIPATEVWQPKDPGDGRALA
jgi:hypothetical protein